MVPTSEPPTTVTVLVSFDALENGQIQAHRLLLIFFSFVF